MLFLENPVPTISLTAKEPPSANLKKKNKNIVIKPDDKGGGAIVINNRSDYVAAGREHLSDATTYKVLKCDPHDKHCKFVNDAINQLEVDEETHFALTPNDSKIPLMYFLSKIHKGIRPPSVCENREWI